MPLCLIKIHALLHVQGTDIAKGMKSLSRAAVDLIVKLGWYKLMVVAPLVNVSLRTHLIQILPSTNNSLFHLSKHQVKLFILKLSM
jgi:hypothetical protein